MGLAMSLNLGLNVFKPQINIGPMSFKPGFGEGVGGVGGVWCLAGPISEGPGNKLKQSF